MNLSWLTGLPCRSRSPFVETVLDRQCLGLLCLPNRAPLMPHVTGFGRSATAIIAAFAAVDPDPVLAAVHGMTVLGIAGELARQQSKGPGSFAVALIDALAGLDRPTIMACLSA